MLFSELVTYLFEMVANYKANTEKYAAIFDYIQPSGMNP